jgi:hypothetical protein
MKILKKRFGFATNSSSSHSVVFWPKHTCRDKDIGSEGPGTSSFGWSEWTAASPKAKRLWWVAQLKQNISVLCGRKCPDEYIDRVVASIAGADVAGRDPQIDHESVVTLPRRHGADVLDDGFYRALVKATLDERFVIIGGNDNERNEHPAALHGQKLNLGLGTDAAWGQAPRERPDHDLMLGPVVSRYDEEFDQYVIFNQDDGTKTRLSFAEFEDKLNKQYPDVTLHQYHAPAGFPELVDLKITNYCTRGCPWCYQGSTAKGKHANYGAIGRIIEALRGAGTFEVAIGGGEPTQHPNFASILDDFRKADIVPNFSTGTLDWFDDDKIMSAVLVNCGSFAYTVRSAADVDSFMTRVKQYNDEHHDSIKLRDRRRHYRPEGVVNVPLASVHLVLGTVTREEFRSIIEKCAAYDLPIVLLAYKPLGRGKGKAPIPYHWWLAEITALKERGINGTISVDTPVAAEYQAELEHAGVRGKYFDTVEAVRSMYIDAVDMKIAPYSYVPKASMDKLLYCEDIPWDGVKIKGKTYDQTAAKAKRKLREIDHQQDELDEYNDELQEARNEQCGVIDAIMRPYWHLADRRMEAQKGYMVKFVLREFRKFRDAALAASDQYWIKEMIKKAQK